MQQHARFKPEERGGKGGGGGEGGKRKETCRLPLLFHLCVGKRLQRGGEKRRGGRKKKSMLSNAKIGKCHFDKCKALCTHRLNFDGSLCRPRPSSLIYKNVKQ